MQIFVYIFLVIGFLALAPGQLCRADELSELNALILKDPQNVELNLRYARVAEDKGELRKALSAYERVMINSPQNYEAQQGFRRIVRKLTPEGTQLTVELGGGWESNPQRLPRGGNPDWLGLARVDLRDERRLGEVTWRTLGNAVGEFYGEQGDIVNYASGTAFTGPVWDLTPDFALHTAIGGGAALYGEHLLQDEALAVFTLESSLWNGAQAGRVRVGYRHYGEFYGNSQGTYVELSERLGFFNVVTKSDVAVITPWYRWSGIAGPATTVRVPFDETQPGRYWEIGLRAEYYRPITDWLTVGGSFAAAYRDYADVTILGNGNPVLRRDRIYVPGVSLIFPKLLFSTADLRIDYRYEDNRSNVPFDNYVDQQVTASVIFRPTLAGEAAAAKTAAAPAPVSITYDWTGFYAGMHGGFGWADFDHTFHRVGHYNLAAGERLGYDGDGGLLGAHLGYNWQAGTFVYGLEGALTKSWIDSGNVRSPFFPSTDVWHSDVDWIASITGRAGAAMNNWLVYAKGGWAWSRVNDHVHDTVDFVDEDRTANGWTLGLGLEYAVTPNWIVGAEYNHYDFGSERIRADSTTFSGGTFFPGTKHDVDTRLDTVLARLTYKFR